MKNFRIGLLVVALISFAYVLTPCDALAQDGGIEECCYRAPAQLIPFSAELDMDFSSTELTLVDTSSAAQIIPANPAVESRKFVYRRMS